MLWKFRKCLTIENTPDFKQGEEQADIFRTLRIIYFIEQYTLFYRQFLLFIIVLLTLKPSGTFYNLFCYVNIFSAGGLHVKTCLKGLKGCHYCQQ